MKVEFAILCDNDKCSKKIIAIKNQEPKDVILSKFTIICEECSEKIKKSKQTITPVTEVVTSTPPPTITVTTQTSPTLTPDTASVIAPIPITERPQPQKGKHYTVLDSSHGRDKECEYSFGNQDCNKKAVYWLVEVKAYTCKEHFDQWAKGWVPE